MYSLVNRRRRKATNYPVHEMIMVKAPSNLLFFPQICNCQTYACSWEAINGINSIQNMLESLIMVTEIQICMNTSCTAISKAFCIIASFKSLIKFSSIFVLFLCIVMADHTVYEITFEIFLAMFSILIFRANKDDLESSRSLIRQRELWRVRVTTQPSTSQRLLDETNIIASSIWIFWDTWNGVILRTI